MKVEVSKKDLIEAYRMFCESDNKVAKSTYIGSIELILKNVKKIEKERAKSFGFTLKWLEKNKNTL